MNWKRCFFKNVLVSFVDADNRKKNMFFARWVRSKEPKTIFCPVNQNYHVQPGWWPFAPPPPENSTLPRKFFFGNFLILKVGLVGPPGDKAKRPQIGHLLPHEPLSFSPNNLYPLAPQTARFPLGPHTARAFSPTNHFPLSPKNFE